VMNDGLYAHACIVAKERTDLHSLLPCLGIEIVSLQPVEDQKNGACDETGPA
jgi:hypothetical protein